MAYNCSVIDKKGRCHPAFESSEKNERGEVSPL
jgi:hypothetical protein